MDYGIYKDDRIYSLQAIRLTIDLIKSQFRFLWFMNMNRMDIWSFVGGLLLKNKKASHKLVSIFIAATFKLYSGVDCFVGGFELNRK